MDNALEKRQKRLSSIDTAAKRLSRLVNIPEGQAEAMSLEKQLLDVIESTTPKPTTHPTAEGMESVTRTSHENSMDAWQKHLKSRQDEVTGGQKLNNLEQTAYLQLIGITPTNDLSGPNRDKEKALIETFEKSLVSIGVAKNYQDDPDAFFEAGGAFETKIATPKSLEFDSVAKNEAIDAFKRGWVANLQNA